MKAIGSTKILHFALVAGMAIAILSSCSGTRYGYINRVKSTEKEERQAKTVNPQENAVPQEETSTAAVSEESPMINAVSDEAAAPAAQHKTQLSSSKKDKKATVMEVKRTILKEMKAAAPLKQKKVSESKASNSLNSDLKLGIILFVIGALLLIFPSPIDYIGYVIMLVGLVFIIIGLIEYL